MCFNYRIVQRSRNLGSHVELLSCCAKGGTGKKREEGRIKEACSALIPTDPRLLTPAQMFRSGRIVDLHRPNQTLWSALGAEKQGHRMLHSLPNKSRKDIINQRAAATCYHCLYNSIHHARELAAKGAEINKRCTCCHANYLPE